MFTFAISNAVAIAILICSVSSAVATQSAMTQSARGSFRGNWVLDKTRSKLVIRGQPESLQIDLAGDDFSVTEPLVSESGEQGPDHTITHKVGQNEYREFGLLMSAKWVGPLVLEITGRREAGGAVVSHWRYEISSDGNTLSRTFPEIAHVAVFRRR
jgi:hypothetical protein